MTTKRLTPKQVAFNFFFANAGYSVAQGETKRQGRSRGARQLAQAERDARALGIRFEWEYDDQPYEDALGDHEYWCDAENRDEEHSHEIYTCTALSGDPSSYDGYGNPTGGAVLASLGAIIDPSNDYRRVIEAELALEALDFVKGGK